MASIAFDIFVRATERIFGLVVIEPNRAPFGLIVTGLAFGTKTPGVNILQPVARYAGSREILVDLIDVTRATVDAPMSSLQGKFGLAVIERLDLLPHRFAVASLAFFAEVSLMRLGLLMAIDTEAGSLAEGDFGQMAALALNVLVGVFKGEVREGMIEDLPIKLDDVRAPSLVIGMAASAI